MAGADFIPSNAINQLEMWQAESFDAALIDKELGYAKSIGMTVMRVYLHHLAWQQDAAKFKQNIDTYLSIADKQGIKTVFVFFDDCWNEDYRLGPQPAPKPSVHNSGWLQDLGRLRQMDLSYEDMLERYVKDVMTRFKDDARILLRDVYNEPGNTGLGLKSLPLVKKVFSWGRQVNPSQPLSAGIWNKDFAELNQFQIENSDVITYHHYGSGKDHLAWIDWIAGQTPKPLICTEYMARTIGSTFAEIMPLLKGKKIIAINWGLVSGKSNTIFAWNTPLGDGAEPKLWFHDIFRLDGSPFDAQETALIKRLTDKP